MVSIKIIAGTIFILALLIFAFTYKSPVSLSDGTIEYSGLLFSERVTRYPMIAEVTEAENRTLGIAVEEFLNFGRVPSGSEVKKTINMYNDESDGVKIKISSEGDISPHVTFSKNNFILRDESGVEIKFYSKETGNYSGILSVSAVKPRNWLSGWFLQWV